MGFDFVIFMTLNCIIEAPSERTHSRAGVTDDDRRGSQAQGFSKPENSEFMNSTKVFLTVAPNKDIDYRIEKEKNRVQKVLKVHENIKHIVDDKMAELKRKNKYVFALLPIPLF